MNRLNKTTVTESEGHQSKQQRARLKKKLEQQAKNAKPTPFGVISNVFSLAHLRPDNNNNNLRKLLIVKYPERPEQKNISTQVSPIQVDQGTSTLKPDTAEIGVQTEDVDKLLEIVPIPVPIYIPCPVPLWNIPVVKPVLIPIVVPCPIMIPLTRYATANIFKIKKD